VERDARPRLVIVRAVFEICTVTRFVVAAQKGLLRTSKVVVERAIRSLHCRQHTHTHTYYKLHIVHTFVQPTEQNA